MNLLSLLAVFSLTGNAAMANQSVFESIPSMNEPTFLKTGEYKRDNFACMLVVAQDDSRIYVQIFRSPGARENCRDDGIKMLFERSQLNPRVYYSTDENATGKPAYLKTIGNNGLFLANTIDQIERGEGNLYINPSCF